MSVPRTPGGSGAAIREHLLPLLFLFLCSATVAAPLFLHGPSCGHDFDFHLLSWLETSHDWNHGLLTPQWLTTANYGAGEPRFIFYPPASWILGALLGSFGTVLFGPQTGWTLAPAFFTLLCVFAAGICVYWLARTMASRHASAVAACLFIANPYMLFVAYERTAYGELLAAPLIALLLLLSFRKALSVPALAAIVAALWLTNAPAAVMGCYTLAFICVLRLCFERDGRNALRAIIGTALGLALAGCYLVPAIWQQRWVQIDRAVASGMRIEDSFLFAHTGQAYHDQVLHTASIIVAILFVVAALAVAAVLITRATRQPRPLWIMAVLLAAILFLQFPVSEPIWQVVPQLAFLQFPWRWMLVASGAIACLLATAITRPQTRSQRWILICYLLASLTVAASIWIGARTLVQACDEQDRVSGELDAFHTGAGVEGTDEYTAADADNSAIYQDLPDVRLLSRADAEEPEPSAGDNPEWQQPAPGSANEAAGSATIQAWQPEKKQVYVTVSQPAFVVLKLMDYPAWNVQLNGHDVIGRLKRQDGLIVVAVPAGLSHILVMWKTTPDVILGRQISGAATVIFLALYLHCRRKPAPGD